MKSKLLIIANNNIGTGQSGGDTIFLEFIKNWQKKLDITVFGAQETKELLNRYHLSPKFIQTDKVNQNCDPTVFNLIRHTLRRIFWGKVGFFTHLKDFKNSHYCYTVSDFYPDFILGLLYKIVNPKGVWLCGQYLFAPFPGSKFSPYEHQPLKGFFYYFLQIFSRFLAQLFADQVLITSEPDRRRFPGKRVVIVQGGVDTTESEKYLKSNKIIPVMSRKYDAVFQGRLHSQKGVLELIDIWKLLIKQKPQAKLAIIGNGQLEQKLKSKIKKLKLDKNIILFGFQSGQGKYDIFKESKLVVHPAIYDSGGMAAAEAMAWGLPGVSFDLEALKTYYPKGMIKSKKGNYQDFSNNIIKLLENKKLYQQTSSEALELIRNVWNWSKRADKLYQQIFK
ncbi:MAG: Glycosyltransferase [Candidatus Shapirobacteria bacterium GW2011_GWE1_38_10]|uniref:Glycosyltransferase n=1 Tax=Candidatus Shapirobacteria bacterium GW2011_GWE1_38_10 TaxID=1618488 RepID=A0A0G0I0G1_9BACT|nr:MAG: Glycosyltransferase [Candidatus Shapirobacteria bacterium GW2011_GWF2_37_20]KKQ48818.1 MAG: Glycosyltransferase [Candidatus Shapirobacteria bacterium GW2011_GWE1_38_10]KKQ63253.1 MAG: Glycosyltransferase [Candidatus Shapirobacteria bacterium GW2011_GWF1_38_23]